MSGQRKRHVFSVTIRAPIEKVWETLTKTDSVLPFFFGAKCVTPGLAVDAPIRMRSADDKYTSVVGKVLEYEPPHLYAHTFRFTTLDDPECMVRYELKSVDGGTEFTLISDNIPVDTKTEKYMVQGSAFIANNLKALVETGKPTASGRFALLMMRLTAFMTPARCRSEHWPF